MARRRKKTSLLEDLYGLFLVVPAWLCVPLALVVFFVVSVALTSFAGTNPIFREIAQFGPLFGGMLALLILATGIAAAIQKRDKRQLYDRQTSIESIRDLSWSQFETLVGEAYRRQGYQIIQTGGRGADGGIDLILNGNGGKILVQCKQWKVYNVGVKPIRELYGVLKAGNADKAVFVTSGVYTPDARKFAKDTGLELVDGEALWRLISPVRDHKVQYAVQNTDSPSPVDTTTPECPRCQSPMILRTAKRGANSGSQFWGCSRYREGCRGTRQVSV